MDPFERKVVRDVAATAGLASNPGGPDNACHVIVSGAAVVDESLEESESSEEGAASDSAPFRSGDVMSANVADDAPIDTAGKSTDPIDSGNAGKGSASSATK